jgi:nitrate/nitrite transporter NarK
MTTVSFYLITAYTPTFGQSELHLTSLASLIVTLCVGLSNFFWLPVMGSASDRFGRKPLLIIFTVLALLTAYPAMLWLTAGPSFVRLLLVLLWLSFIYGSYNEVKGNGGHYHQHHTEQHDGPIRCQGANDLLDGRVVLTRLEGFGFRERLAHEFLATSSG